ncbi:hypothetical protein OsccyDRAFT_0805 [Leptolyngbyaceae cyanobacterium JSC-12]|nr:hypothetical protein OsccyDRAFT_0805 [Leptolyngbyaceae cyanobacterium JSC-12]
MLSVSIGDQEAPEVDLASDYDAAKKMSTGMVDAETTQQLVKPQFEVSISDSVVTGAELKSESAGYAEMAKKSILI